MIDCVSEMYWSSRNAKAFVDNMKAYYKGNVQAGRVIARGFPHFALGFCNGVYGDIAIPLVLAGASGALGPRIKHNIWWACRVILQVYNAVDYEAIAKLGAVFALNNPAMVSGKVVSSIYLWSLYRRVGLPLGVAGGVGKLIANPVSLAIIGFISHKRLILKLNHADRLFVFVYILLTGDNTLEAFDHSESGLKRLLSLVSADANQFSTMQLNVQCQTVVATLAQAKKMLKTIKGFQ